jgi:hypothetical protein
MVSLWKNIILETLLVSKTIEYYKEKEKKMKEEKEPKSKEINDIEKTQIQK